MKDFEEMLDIASNVYRTKNYIVCQLMCYRSHAELGNDATSEDVFFERDPLRDAYYEDRFCERIDIDGKRMPTTMYSRKYIK